MSIESNQTNRSNFSEFNEQLIKQINEFNCKLIFWLESYHRLNFHISSIGEVFIIWNLKSIYFFKHFQIVAFLKTQFRKDMKTKIKNHTEKNETIWARNTNFILKGETTTHSLIKAIANLQAFRNSSSSISLGQLSNDSSNGGWVT